MGCSGSRWALLKVYELPGYYWLLWVVFALVAWVGMEVVCFFTEVTRCCFYLAVRAV